MEEKDANAVKSVFDSIMESDQYKEFASAEIIFDESPFEKEDAQETSFEESAEDTPEEPAEDTSAKADTAEEPIENIPEKPTETPDIPEVETNSAIPNTYGDLFDTPQEQYYDVDEEKWKDTPMDTQIDSLDNLSLQMDFPSDWSALEAELEKHISNFEPGPLKTNVKFETEEFTLSSYIHKMPHGIVDKQVAGIGATTLEINSKRNSIIVVPTKILAYNKHIKHKDKTLYVGGRISEGGGPTSDKEITDYIANNAIIHKKFLVVADSLPKLLNQIGEKNYKDYFLMIDEVDMIQSESTYRPVLESLIDYYFLFPPKNRCLVTATMSEFSNPQLQQECKFKLTWENPPKRNIQLYFTDNLSAITAESVQQINKSDKIIVAFNSIRHCKNIIKLLPEKIQKECAILCSDSSIDEAEDYYGKLTSENKLPKRINFITSCYFAGVDIEDTYHLITVSNAQQNYQMLSLNKMIQIYGRCRIPKGILSDTIIYNTRDDKQKNTDKNYQATLLKQATAIQQLQKAASELGNQDADLADLFRVVKTAIREKAAVQLPREDPIKLTRKNIYDENVPAYMNIDYLVERQKLCNTIYNSYKNLPAILKKQGHTIKFEYKSISLTETQQELDTSNKKELQGILDKQLSPAMDEIREIAKQRGELSKADLAKYLSQKGCKEYTQRLYKLRTLADIETLIDKLWEIRHSDKRAYKNLQNAAVFWALDDKHPFKRDLFRVFKIGKKYKTAEIHELMAPLVKYHLHKTIKQRATVSLLKALFLVERPKIYLIKGKNPVGFKKTGSLRIAKTEENLLKYFTL